MGWLQVVALVRVYVKPLYAALVLEVLWRPLNKILVAQRITRPQLYCTIVTFALHWPITHTLMVRPCSAGSCQVDVHDQSPAWLQCTRQQSNCHRCSICMCHRCTSASWLM